MQYPVGTASTPHSRSGCIVVPYFRNHVDLINKIDGADLETAASIAGSRFYYLKRDILHLNLALIQFALSELESEGYIPMQTPFFVKGEVAAETSELGEFEETLYKVEGEDMYLIATAEQTLAFFVWLPLFWFGQRHHAYQPCALS